MAEEKVTRERNARGGLGWVLVGILALVLGWSVVSYFAENKAGGNVLGAAQVGEQINISGQIDEVINPLVFTMKVPELTSESVLVIVRKSDQEIPTGLKSGDRIFLSGTIRQFNRRELEGELGSYFMEERINDWDGEGIIVADEPQKIS